MEEKEHATEKATRYWPICQKAIIMPVTSISNRRLETKTTLTIRDQQINLNHRLSTIRHLKRAIKNLEPQVKILPDVHIRT